MQIFPNRTAVHIYLLYNFILNLKGSQAPFLLGYMRNTFFVQMKNFKATYALALVPRSFKSELSSNGWPRPLVSYSTSGERSTGIKSIPLLNSWKISIHPPSCICISSLSATVINSVVKKKLGDRGFSSFRTSKWESIAEGSQGSGLRLEPWSRNFTSDHGVVLLPGLLSRCPFSTFLLPPRTTYHRLAPPTTSWSLP